ncbi:MAG: hypothetical protein IT330_10940 [Anaerolineae bacterium]|nr:hypothetical protein [Anaerolineae bacterium]
MPNNPTAERIVYRGDHLRAVAMPLGGLGTGSIALCGDGSLRQWQLFNTANHLAMVPHSVFAIWAQKRTLFTKPVVRILQSAETYDHSRFSPAPLVNDHVVPAACTDLLKRFPGVPHVEFVGEYPIAQVAYLDDTLPVKVSLEAFSPMIPLNDADSGLPAIFFRFSVENPGEKGVTVSLAATLQNAVGWDGITPIWGVESPLFGGNRNTVLRLAGMTALEMRNVHRRQADVGYGQMVLATLNEGATFLSQWDDLEEWWADFSQDGALANGEDSGPSPEGRTWNGALAVPLRLEPGQKGQATFVLAWYFPNRYVDWDQERYNVTDTQSRFFIGNRYAARFPSALAVMEYVRDHAERLTHETRLFRDTFYDSTLPYWLLDAITAPVSTLRTPACLWSADDHFYGFEGCAGESVGLLLFGGCCPMNCTHVWNYEFALARLFPRLERSMRDVDLLVQQAADGGIPYRTILPLYLPRWSESRYNEAIVAADGHFGTILKVYREYRQAGDRDWLAQMWPRVRQAMTYAFTTWDADGDGLCDGPQWVTYDGYLQGHNAMVSGLYLAALRACEEMAKLQEDKEFAGECRARYERGRANLDAVLWNGDYYIQKYDAEKHPKRQHGTGCHADQLVGQWWAHLLGLGHLLPAEHVQQALASLFRYNWRPNQMEHNQGIRPLLRDDEPGLLICTWPLGGRPGPSWRDVTVASDEVWTGTEYAVAGAMLYEGLIEEAFTVARTARDRHDGARRSPWNEIECGDHYVRAMSSWALLDAVAGYRYDAGDGFLGFAPRLTPESFRAFFIGARGWGALAQQVNGHEQRVMLTVAYGEVIVQKLVFRRAEQVSVQAVKVIANGQAVEAGWLLAEGETQIGLNVPVSVTAGQTLEVVLGSAP